MSKFLSILSIVVCMGLRAASAQPSPDSSAAGKASWGKIVGEKKSKAYTTRDGRHTYEVGGTIRTGLGSSEQREFQYVRAHVSGNRFVKALIPDIAALEKEYEDTDFTITDIYEGYSKVSDALVRNAPKTVFIVFETKARSRYEAAIEKALKAGEIEAN